MRGASASQKPPYTATKSALSRRQRRAQGAALMLGDGYGAMGTLRADGGLPHGRRAMMPASRRSRQYLPAYFGAIRRRPHHFIRRSITPQYGEFSFAITPSRRSLAIHRLSAIRRDCRAVALMPKRLARQMAADGFRLPATAISDWLPA